MALSTFDAIAIAKEKFKFLETLYKFKLVKAVKDRWGYRLLYLSDSVGIEITHEYREGCIFILLYKLVDGKLIDSEPTLDAPIYVCDLNDILKIRNPSAIIRPTYKYGNESKYHDKEKGFTFYVSDFADNLATYAKDVLEGNLEIFDETEEFVKERIRLAELED